MLPRSLLLVRLLLLPPLNNDNDHDTNCFALLLHLSLSLPILSLPSVALGAQARGRRGPSLPSGAMAAAIAARAAAAGVAPRGVRLWCCTLSLAGSLRAEGPRDSWRRQPGCRQQLGRRRLGFASAGEAPVPGMACRAAPSLGRLRLPEPELRALLALGRREGPRAAYQELVRGGHLEPNEAQACCAELLQDFWAALSGGSSSQHPSRGCYVWGSYSTVYSSYHIRSDHIIS